MSSESIRFWDGIAERYARRPVADEATYQKKLAITREYLAPHMQVFEFGCGTGSTALEHAPLVAHVRATDLSAKMIQIARDKATARGIDNVSFECVGLDRVQVEDESMDVVLGLSILHLLPDWEAAIGAVHRMLKPGGVFVTSTACLGDSLLRLLGWCSPIGRRLGLMPHVEVFSARRLRQTQERAGFGLEVDWRQGATKAVFMVARKR